MNKNRAQRQRKIRRRIRGTAMRPRVSVFRSSRYIGAQLIDDESGRTLLAVNSQGLKLATKKPGSIAIAEAVGKEVAKQSQAAGISAVVFDRSGHAYHGRVKALAEGLRSGGLQV